MKTILKLPLLALLLIVVSPLTAQSTTKDFNEFSGVIASGNIEMTLIADNENYAKIRGDEDDIEKLKIEMKGSNLKFALRNKGLFNWFGNIGKVHIELHYSETLSYINTSASADIRTLETMISDELKLNSSSGSSIELDLDCNKLKANLSSGAEIILEGEIGVQDIIVSSGANYKSSEAASAEVYANASSGGDIKVWVEDKIEGHASSGASIRYKGEPNIRDLSSSSGGGIKSIN